MQNVNKAYAHCTHIVYNMHTIWYVALSEGAWILAWFGATWARMWWESAGRCRWAHPEDKRFGKRQVRWRFAGDKLIIWMQPIHDVGSQELAADLISVSVMNRPGSPNRLQTIAWAPPSQVVSGLPAKFAVLLVIAGLVGGMPLLAPSNLGQLA